MKKFGLIGVGALVIMGGLAIVVAGQMGETSDALVKGSVVLDDSLTADAAGATALFIIISGTDRPMPYGAYRQRLGSNPQGTIVDFVLTRENTQAMVDPSQWPAEFKVKARIDRDGVAGPDQPGDLVGEVTLVHKGQEGVEVRIARKI